MLPRGVAALPVGGSDGRHVRGRGPRGIHHDERDAAAAQLALLRGREVREHEDEAHRPPLHDARHPVAVELLVAPVLRDDDAQRMLARDRRDPAQQVDGEPRVDDLQHDLDQRAVRPLGPAPAVAVQLHELLDAGTGRRGDALAPVQDLADGADGHVRLARDEAEGGAGTVLGGRRPRRIGKRVGHGGDARPMRTHRCGPGSGSGAPRGRVRARRPPRRPRTASSAGRWPDARPGRSRPRRRRRAGRTRRRARRSSCRRGGTRRRPR